MCSWPAPGEITMICTWPPLIRLVPSECVSTYVPRMITRPWRGYVTEALLENEVKQQVSEDELLHLFR